MNGVLSFALGLNAGGFVSSLGAADARLKGFIGGMVGLGAIVAGVQKAVEKGAGLKQLSDQTSESIGNLYRLQQGFKAVGLDASGVGSTLFMLNKALGGINDNGEPTAGVFAQMGLSIDGLKKLNAPQQLLSIASALGKLDVSSATSASGKIFGRYSAREFLQLARNADEFADALRKGGVQAAIFDHYGRTFEKIEVLTEQLKESFSGIFAGLAAGIGPALETVLKMLNNIDLSKIGAGIGTVITGFVEAFREGKLSDIIGDTLKLGFDSLLAYAPGIFIKIGATLLKAFETPLTYIQAGMEYALTNAMQAFASKSAWISAIGNILGVPVPAVGDASAPTFAQILADRKKDGVKFDLGSGEFDTSDMQQAGNDSLAAGKKNLAGEVNDYLAKIAGLASRAPQPDALDKMAGKKEGSSLGGMYSPYKSALEKMGYVFRGGSASDPATQTARHTREMATGIKQIVSIISHPGGKASFADTYQQPMP